MPKYPKRVRAGTEHTVFERRPGLYSVRSERGADVAGAMAVLADDARTSFSVYEGEPRAEATGEYVGPVYSAGPDGPLAVPTGRIFVRLAEGMAPDERRAEFEAAGFEIERTLSYAPNAAWLRPARGGVAHALTALSVLERIPGVAHVEPQMLLERAFKGPSKERPGD